jgi:hypothetical protein
MCYNISVPKRGEWQTDKAMATEIMEGLRIIPESILMDVTGPFMTWPTVEAKFTIVSLSESQSAAIASVPEYETDEPLVELIINAIKGCPIPSQPTSEPDPDNWDVGGWVIEEDGLSIYDGKLEVRLVSTNEEEDEDEDEE